MEGHSLFGPSFYYLPFYIFDLIFSNYLIRFLECSKDYSSSWIFEIDWSICKFA